MLTSASVWRLVGTRACLVATCLMVSPVLQAQSPEEYQALQEQTDFRSDWYNTRQFDLDNPVKVDVTIHGIEVPELGHAKLLFTPVPTFEMKQHRDFDPDAVMRATLQLAEELDRLELSERYFEKGIRATLTGWPAVRLGESPSVMLIDEIEFASDSRSRSAGRKIKLHPEHEKMRKFGDTTPKKSDELKEE